MDWSVIWSTLGSAFLGAFIGGGIAKELFIWFLNRNKIKKEQKARLRSVIGEKIANALDAVRKIELRSVNYEIFDIEKMIKEGKNIDYFGGETYYPEFMNDFDSFEEFSLEINNARRQHEEYLDCETAVFLLYAERYILQLAGLIRRLEGENKLQKAGLIFIVDIQKWQKAFEKILVKKINSASCKIEEHDGKKWERVKEKYEDKIWKKSILYGVIHGVMNEDTYVAMKVMEELGLISKLF